MELDWTDPYSRNDTMSPPPARCPFPGCDGVYNECRRKLVCPECGRHYFGRVQIPAERLAAAKPEVSRYQGLIVTADPWGGWSHPCDEGCSLAGNAVDGWVRPLTWDEYPVAVELERTFWSRQGMAYTEDLSLLRSLPSD